MPNKDKDFDFKLPELIELRQSMYNQILGVQAYLANVDINDLPSDYDKVVNLYELLKKDYKELCVCIDKLLNKKEISHNKLWDIEHKANKYQDIIVVDCSNIASLDCDAYIRLSNSLFRHSFINGY